MLAIAAAAMIPLTLIVGSAVDMSVAYLERAKLQNACDSAVLAGRQVMEGVQWRPQDKRKADDFFDFNFRNRAGQVRDIEFEIAQNENDLQELIGTATASVPTGIMKIVGIEIIPISVSCDAKRDQGHNDVVLVLDVTGSMAESPSSGGGTKIGNLREGAVGLFRALDDDGASQTRYGIVPYSQTVNIGRTLRNRDFLKRQEYVTFRCNRVRCFPDTKWVHINQSSWNNASGDEEGNMQGFRTSGNACIEERPTIGNPDSPIEIEDFVTRDDIDLLPDNANDTERQFGRYDPGVQEGESFSACPAEASKLATYADEANFRAAINAATSRVRGNTYHDMGMLWGARFISRTGFFSDDNPTEIDGITVRQHIVFMTDGELRTDRDTYSAHSIERFLGRTRGSGSLDDRHIERFRSVCNVARAMGVTVWVIALDVEETEDVAACATSEDHFFPSDGSDLEQVFERIGQGIGNLRLTR